MLCQIIILPQAHKKNYIKYSNYMHLTYLQQNILQILDIIIKMSRVTNRQFSSPTNIPAATTNQKSQQNMPYIIAGAKILKCFFSIKQRNNACLFFNKCRKLAEFNKKRNSLICKIIGNLYIRKTSKNISYGLKKLQQNRDIQIKKQIQAIQALKITTKNKSTILITSFLRRFQKKLLSQAFEQLNNKTKILLKMNNFRSRQIARIFNILVLQKQREGFIALGNNSLAFLKIKNILNKVGRLVQYKKNGLILTAFAKLKNIPNNVEVVPKEVQSKISKNSRVTPATKPQPSQTEKQITKQQEKIKQVQMKNQAIEKKIFQTKQQFEKILAKYKQEIAKLEEDHQSLKFNSGILDEAIQDLQGQIIQRQKKSRKTMPISEVWDKVYCNFLLLIKQHSGQTLPKKKVLQYIQTPLTPLNIGIDTIKAENEVLTQLLSQYRKIFQTAPEQQKQESILPYDILVTKNRFLYAAVETLIRHGVGTQAEVKQLEHDLQNATKQA